MGRDFEQGLASSKCHISVYFGVCCCLASGPSIVGLPSCFIHTHFGSLSRHQAFAFGYVQRARYYPQGTGGDRMVFLCTLRSTLALACAEPR